MKQILLLWLFCLLNMAAEGQDHPVQGTVVTTDEPLAGASVSIKGTSKGVITDANGEFILNIESGTHTLVVSYIGFEAIEQQIEVPLEGKLSFTLVANSALLDEVQVISTGYEEIPKERVTGSFVQLGPELVNRRVSANLLERMEDITPGLIFNRDIGGLENDISIRGTSTIFADARPLIIIDNFPYDGPLENINPNDVKSITVLKDAAAASIWGARAGNGVIVITTKSGRSGDMPRITFNSNISIRETPDLFYQPQMEISDFIDMEEQLFYEGVYTSRENSRNKSALSPVVETLIALRDGLITVEEANSRIAYYKTQDIRGQTEDIFYQPSVEQQYALNMSGGSKGHRYNFSTGYDRGRSALQGNENSRLTLSTKNDWKLLKDKLDVSAGVYYVRGTRFNGTDAPSGNLAPYTPLVGEEGEPLPVIYKYSDRFVHSVEEQGLHNWQLFPVAEIGLNDHTTLQQDIRLNASASYEFIPGLQGGLFYQYWSNNNESRLLYPEESFYSRDLINTFTSIDDDGNLVKAIPDGAILDMGRSAATSHNLRGQLRYHKEWGSAHQINAIGGFEIRDYQSESNSTRYYGYDDELGLSMPMDYTTRFRRFHNNSLSYIPHNNDHSGIIDRFVSYYTNASYINRGKYLLSFSARKDASNLFGVDTNQKGIPLWSAGMGWIINEEGFYNLGWLPYLKLRATYGYNGNTIKNVTAYPTALYRSSGGIYGLPYAQILSPPNPELRWEKIKIINVGLDFETARGILSGSIEGFLKSGLDLIGDTPYPTSSGVSQFRGNYANTSTAGLDIILKSQNLAGQMRWSTIFMFSHINEKVTHYEAEDFTSSYLNYGGGAIGWGGTPLEGRPLYGIYSLGWAGLDPDTGDPLGFVDGEPSNDYIEIAYYTDPEGLRFHGSGRPVSFGSLRNELSWNNLSLSFNITYRLGYFYRRTSVNYEDLMQGDITHSDYYQRWQNPGDELSTDVPSQPEARDRNRNYFYMYSAALIEPGDHIRFQDIRVAYLLERKSNKLPFKNVELYAYANNLGLIWKASDYELDPDYRTMKPQRSISLGMRFEF